MESLSRPLHRRKLSNATSFAGKNAYDGVFSGHRPNYAGAPAAKVEDYREIFSSAQSASSIPVLDLPTLEESSGGSHLELGSSKPDYGRIFGGFCEEDVAVSYEVLLARDKDRVSSSTSPSSQDLNDLSHQPSDALKQFNMSYHKISQRNKDGLDGKTHVTQLHAVPGFTCFIDETAPPQKETKKQNPSVINNIHPNVDSKNEDLPEKQTSESAVKSRSKDCQDESLSDDKINKIFEVDPKSNASKVSSPPVDNHKDYQKRSTDVNSGTSKSDTCEEFSFTYFDEELDVNSAAAASSAALKKAIEKAQESIRIAKESVGRKKEGLRSFTSRSFKDSLKVKARPENISEEQKRNDNEVGRNHKYGGLGVFSDFMNGEKLFGAKKVINEIHVKVSESAKKSEIPVSSSHEVCDSKEVSGETEAANLDSDGKYEHATVSSEPVENNTYEAPNEDEAYAQRPKGFLEIESLEKKLEETEDVIKDDEPRELKENKDEVILSNARKLVEESNNLTVYLEVEDETKISHKLNEEMGLLENEKQEVLEQEDVEKVENDEASENGVENENENENELKEEDETDKEEDTGEKFYDVYEPETNEISQINAYSLEKSEVSPKKKENHETWETLDEVAELDINENSSSDYDDAEESESVCNIVTDTEETREEVVEFQVEFEKISLDQTASEENEDDREEKDDDMSNCGFADVEFKQNETEQNDVQSESSSDTINGMEIEVNELKERNEMEKDEIPEIRENEPIKEVEKDDHKRIEEREREKNKLAVERAIREARERAFAEARERAERATVERVNAEVRERVMADAREKVAKASVGTKLSDRTSELAKLRAERAAVERATSEARQRALEKAMSQKNVSDRTSVSHDLNTSNGTESAQRSKAKLEKHNRIMERAAKALAEKEKRDMLVQKEQAERNRLAENLDADIKRWSSGKEGNLRALLSTLQYILGADGGWQPVSLTEIITNSAVKKAYRKATLCVHPDKLQQRGASIQQKYICEKVFDLLKAAWNRFNSEER